MKKVSKSKILQLHAEGFSIRQIAKITGVSKSTVHRVVNGDIGKERKKGEKHLRIYKSMSQTTKNKLRTLLTMRTEEKGTSRVLSNAQIYEHIKLNLLADNVKLSKSAFYEFLDYFIIREFGSQENLEKQRRLKKEISKFVQSKGTVKREVGLWEIDATGYSFNNKNYSVMQVIDTFTGYVFPAMIIENKEKNAKHYNKAFNSLDVAYYLMTLFIQYGVPKAIKSDNEKIIKNDYIINALKELGVEYRNTKSYNPSSKVIERFFRSLKDTARTIRATGFEGEFSDLWHLAIEHFNKESHNFKHIQGTFSPLELVNSYGLGTREIDEETIRLAFAERFERKVINNQIKIDNLVYEFIYHKPKTELGRKRKNLTVLCLRDLENVTNLFVYNAQTGEYLGTAKLISQSADLETIKDKQIKQKQKRINKRIQKLEAEKTILETEALQEDPYKIELPEDSLLEELTTETEEKSESFEETEDLDILSQLLSEEE
ncbi:Helix-turn-helix domain of resolvase [Persephonella hydrogeniphila]|uniref:Helix-turn-helix domain of resolvase n=1 Tax=Persephonella hydrogeniphila TaxID=198703 RepID=A0A285NFL7_9AQUI|nr:helix-turn-helix domain-containing protein [Persephonella hydrogeniphila]SNZ08260.1 Helix-turn-helix domain of resolvase [Persephonella hydrogeniphila]